MIAVTQKQIAEKLGLSAQSVRFALSDDIAKQRQIRPETRQRIRELAAQTGYFPHHGARSLTLGKTNTIGVVSHLSNSIHQAEQLNAISEELEKAGYKISLSFRRPEDMRRERENIEDFLARRVEGIVIFNDSHCDTTYYESIRKRQIPLVFCGLFTDPKDFSIVDKDSITGMYEAAKYLLDIGHRNIAYAIGKEAIQFLPQHRLSGFRRALTEANVPIRLGWCMENTSCTRKAVHHFTQKIMQEKVRPTAIMYSDDELALVGLHALLGMGFRVPDDVSVIGFDDMPLAQLTWPELTTVGQKASEFGSAVLSLLLRQINGDFEPPVSNPVLKPHLIIRQSTGPVPKGSVDTPKK